MRRKSVFYFKKYLILVYILFWLKKKKKSNLIYQKKYGASQYIKRLLCIRNEDPNFQNSVTDIVNNRSNLRNFLLVTSSYRRNTQENISAVVADGKFNQAVVCRALDQ